jgi:hypothetical protein
MENYQQQHNTAMYDQQQRIIHPRIGQGNMLREKEWKKIFVSNDNSQ